MTLWVTRLRIVVLAAYLLAAFLPALAQAQTSPPTPAEHGQMMAMAGHVAQMPGMDGPIDAAMKLLCQQHCLAAVATFPTNSPAPERSVRVQDLVVADVRVALSLTTPPPGPPPKVAAV